MIRLLFRLALLLLPARLRCRASAEMVEVFDARVAMARGPRARARAGLYELTGLLTAALRARLRDPLASAVELPSRTRSTMMDRLVQDVRFAWRSIRRRPGPAVLAVLTFALGIAASTAMFSVVDAVLLRPLSYPEPERIVSVYADNPWMSDHPTMSEFAARGSWSFPELRALRDDSEGVLDGLAIVTSGGTTLYGDGEPERIPLGLTTQDLFGRVLRVTPLVGRVFDDEDARAGAGAVLLTEGFWHRRYGGDPAVVGTVMHFGDTPVPIVGVLPADATLAGFETVAAWSLISGDDNWGNHWTNAIGRLATGVSIEQAEARLTSVIGAAIPAGHDVHGVNLFERHGDETRFVRGPLVLLSAAALVLLLVACGNVAALLVGAAIDRQQEVAVRAALGAGRMRLVRQMLTESVALAGLAAVVGIALTAAATRGLVLLAPDGVPRVAEATVDLRALLFAVGVALVCGIVFGLIPALGFSRADLRQTMNAATRGTTGNRGRIQAAVVVGELALATVLLVGGGLLARTLLALNDTDPGFAAEETLGLNLSIPFSRILADTEGDEARTAAADVFYRTLMERIEAVPGVSGVAMTSNLPLSPARSNNDVEADGTTVIAERRFVSHDYFEVMGIRIVDGRGFEENDDRADAPVHVVVSDGLARRLWPDGSAVGRRMSYWGRDGVVIGVAEDIRDEEMRNSTALSFYAARRQAQQLGGSIVIRTTVAPQSLVAPIRQRVREIHPDIAITSVRPLTDLIRDQLAAERYRARLVIVFSVMAGLFALMGIYGVTARSVAARTRELGIRKALGAQRTGILGLVLGQALRLALAGAMLGVVISFIATRSIEAYLWGVPRTDPVTLVSIAALMGFASILAALAPGRRAARIDPIEALRTE